MLSGLSGVNATSAAASGPPDSSAAGESAITVPGGFAVADVLDGLDRPTQIAVAGEDLIVAQLNGGESDGTGQVLRIAIDDPNDREVLFADLLKPTGIAVLDDELWVMQERSLSRGPLAGGELETVLSDLPYNGRSEGTLTVSPDGQILYNTSGTLDGVDAVSGSATLWALTPGEEPEALATGFKNAYGRTFAPDGTLWQAEISDGTYDGAPAPDELVRVEAGDDFGWPQCIGDRLPVEFYDGTDDRCANTPRSHALFDPGSTPTSVAVAPWNDNVLLVSLWVQSRIVAVPAASGDDTSSSAPDSSGPSGTDDDGGPVEYTDFITGIERPQFLLADGDRLLVVDYGGGRIVAVTESTG